MPELRRADALTLKSEGAELRSAIPLMASARNQQVPRSIRAVILELDRDFPGFVAAPQPGAPL
jgi:hypothetical protein